VLVHLLAHTTVTRSSDRHSLLCLTETTPIFDTTADTVTDLETSSVRVT